MFEPKLSIRDKFSVLKSVSQNEISGSSKYVREFEKQFSDLNNRNYGVAVSNGSAALDVALELLSLKKGDEVIVPSHTIISCLSAVIRTGATPIFCDVDSLTWNMTLNNVKEKFSDNTKAVIAVHTFGLPAEISEISNFCKENSLYLIEDAAEAHGQYENGSICGSFGDISTFSFYANKHMTTGEGGMLLTNNKNFYEGAIQIRNLDFTRERFKHNNLYWNYRLSGIQAALGISQIKGLEKTINQKISQGERYIKLLENNTDIFQLPLLKHNGSVNHFWVFGILLQKNGIRDKVVNELLNNGIETRPFFWPLHMQPVLKKYKIISEDSLEVSEKLGSNGFYIPIGDHLSIGDQKFVAKKLIETVKSYS